MKMRKWLKRLLIAAAIIALTLAGLRFWAVQYVQAHIEDAPLGQSIGPEDATSVVVEFMDYRCPACRGTYPALMEFHEKHPHVRIVFRHLTLFGEQSIIEASLALAAGLNGKFIEMHDLLMAREEPLQDEDIDVLARQVGLNPEGLRMDMGSTAITKELMFSALAASALSIRATPSFVLNGKLLVEGDDIEQLLQTGQ